MEALSGIASFITIAGILQGLYRKLNRYAKALAKAATDARELAKEVSNFAGLLLLVEDTLTGLRDVMQKSTRFVLVEKSQNAGARALIHELQELIRDLPILLNIGQRNFLQKWLMRHRWTAMTNDIRKLQCSVERSKSSLTLFVGIVQLEHNKTLLQRSEHQSKVNQLEHTEQVRLLKARMFVS